MNFPGFFCLGQSTRQASDYWIRHWVNDTLQLYPKPEPNSASRIYASVHIAMTILFAILVFCRGSTFFCWSNTAANKFFQTYVNRTFGAPLAFFLNNSAGDLINVFSKDQVRIGFLSGYCSSSSSFPLRQINWRLLHLKQQKLSSSSFFPLPSFFI
jgi:hypothetical protein